jgi:hypothetical protein
MNTTKTKTNQKTGKPSNGKQSEKKPEHWKITFTISSSREQWTRWNAAAKADGRNLSQFICRRMDEADARAEELAGRAVDSRV